jgi:hypothetical protein
MAREGQNLTEAPFTPPDFWRLSSKHPIILGFTLSHSGRQQNTLDRLTKYQRDYRCREEYNLGESHPEMARGGSFFYSLFYFYCFALFGPYYSLKHRMMAFALLNHQERMIAAGHKERGFLRRCPHVCERP